jgi:hypothetical protein
MSRHCRNTKVIVDKEIKVTSIPLWKKAGRIKKRRVNINRSLNRCFSWNLINLFIVVRRRGY